MAETLRPRPDAVAESQREKIAEAVPLLMIVHPNKETVRPLWLRSTDRVRRVITANVAATRAATSVQELRDLAQWQFDAQQATPTTTRLFKAPADPEIVSAYIESQPDIGTDPTRFINRKEEIHVARHLKERLDELLDPDSADTYPLSYLQRETAGLLTMIDVAVYGQAANALQNLKARLSATRFLTDAAFDIVPAPELSTPKVILTHPSRETTSGVKTTPPRRRTVFDPSIDAIDAVLEENAS